ncbi:LPS export ABC transporter permease LptF [Sneathiella chinensis]|uniref:LPS export ABC transporter permease LptF n=2 Tax=Sneathiella chinensis TaxID=349750 RepID=A0ABQ5U830_9PROT|nr:LPS export ABC transporter permease LptF [Sneathiella chinensis]
MMRQFAVPTLFITFALTGVVWLSQSLQFVEKLINGLPVGTFLYLTLLLLPGILKYTLLLGLFFGTLFAFNKLYTDSELVVMWSAGLSKWSLTRPALYLALIVTLGLYFLGFVLSPFGLRTITELRVEWRDSLASVVLREGVFNTLSRDVTVYIREKTSNGELLGILVHDERNPEKPMTYMAEKGAFINTEAGPRFVMQKGNIQEVQKDQAKLSILYFDDYTLDVSQFEKAPGLIWLKPEARYLNELLFPGDDAVTQRNLGKIRSELHQRFVLPLYALALVYIASAGVLSGEFTRRSKGRKLLIAGASGIGLIIIAMALFRVSDFNIFLIPLLYGVPLVAAGIAAWLASGGTFRLRSRRGQPPLALAEGDE